MPIQVNRKKNLTELTATDDVAVTPEVHASMNVQAKRRDVSGIVNALSGITAKMQHTAKENKQKKDDEHAVKGQQDELLGRVDEELEANSKAYRDSRAQQRAVIDGIEWLNERQQELDDKVANDPDFFTEDGGKRYQEWKQATLNEYLGSRENPLAVETANKVSVRMLEQMDSKFVSHQAKIAEADAQNDLNRLVVGMYDAGGIKTAADVQRLFEQGDAINHVDSDEARAAILTMLMPKIEDGDLALTEALRPLVGDNVKMTTLLDEAHEAGQAVIKRREEDAHRERVRTDTKFWNRLEDTIFAGGSVGGMADWAVANNYASAEEAANWRSQARARREALADKARAAREKAEEDRRLSLLLLGGAGGVVDPEASKKKLDGMFGEAFLGLRAAQASGDPDQVAAANRRVSTVIETAKLNGMAPTGLKNFLNNADFTHGPRLESMIRWFNDESNKGNADYLAQHMDSASFARLSVARNMHATGMPPDQIATTLQRARQVDPAVARTQVTGATKELKAAVKELGGTAYAQREITEMAQQIVMMTDMPASEAIAMAEEGVKARSVMFGGRYVPATHASENADKAAREHVRRVALPLAQRARKGVYEDEDALRYMPITEAPGSFILMDMSDPNAPKAYMQPSKDGKARSTVIKTEAQMRTEAAAAAAALKRIEARNADQERRERDEAALERRRDNEARNGPRRDPSWVNSSDAPKPTSGVPLQPVTNTLGLKLPTYD